MKFRSSKQRIQYLGIVVAAIILTIAGWRLPGFLGQVAETEFKHGLDQDLNLVASFLRDNLEDADNAARTLSQSDEMIAALSSGSPADLERANKILDRYQSSLEMSICCLLDHNGMTVASSNINQKTGFVGKSFASRPFVTGALAGRLTTYFGLGLLTRERGYFAAAPVVDSNGIITGVVFIKRNIDLAGEIFRNYTHAFLVSPEGIIFISSREELLYTSLWPVAEKRRPELQASRQFGDITFAPLLAAEPRTGTYVRFENEKHYVLRLPFGNDGWTLVVLGDPHIVSTYRWFGITLTMAFGLLLLFFFIVLLYKDKALETTRDLLKVKGDWQKTFDTVSDPIAIIGSNHRIISMNRPMAERLGISQQEAVGRWCYELVHSSQEPPPSCPHQRMLASGRPESGCLSAKKLNGDFIVTVSPLLAKDGTIESSVHVMHDITELKRLEQSLKEYVQRLEFVLEGANDATWEWDLIADQTIVNARWYEMMESPPGEIGLLTLATFLKSIHPEDVSGVQRRLQDTLGGKCSEFVAQYRPLTKSGRLKRVVARGKIVRHTEDGRPAAMAGVITDLTELTRLNDEVHKIHNLESIGHLAGGLAHDFNNVLNIIYGNITFAKMLAGDNAAFVEPLADAEEACERAKELGLRLQGFSLGSSPENERIALAAMIEDVVETLFKDTTLSHTITETADLLPVEADPRQIRQVFENLLTNAKEAMSESGTVKIDIENFCVDGKKGIPLGSGLYARIAIQDDGKGIPEEILPKIFDPYFSTKDTYSQRGLGLGLSLCHAIIKKHRGHILVESKLGDGTRVSIYLPASMKATEISPEG